MAVIGTGYVGLVPRMRHVEGPAKISKPQMAATLVECRKQLLVTSYRKL